MESLAAIERPIADIVVHRMGQEQVVEQVRAIQEIMSAVMKDGEHYGIIPGTIKPTLLKAGAEKLATTFRLAPSFAITKTDLGNGHREIEVLCTLAHIISGATVGQGVGSCSTLESRYRWRGGKRICPECGKDSIIKGKKDYGGGWLCYKNKGGCGYRWSDGDKAIEDQHTERTENPDIADQYNTVLKMAKKRALVDAILTATAASDIFTQDVEDLPQFEPAMPIKSAPAMVTRDQLSAMDAQRKRLGWSPDALIGKVAEWISGKKPRDLLADEATIVLANLNNIAPPGDGALNNDDIPL